MSTAAPQPGGRRLPLGAILLTVVAILLCAEIVVQVAAGRDGHNVAVTAPRDEPGTDVVGTWRGTATFQGDDAPVEVDLRIDGLAGAGDGRLEESTSAWHCAGSLAFSRREGDAVVFTYAEERDPRACSAQTTVTVRPTATGGLEFRDVGTDSEGGPAVVAGQLAPAAG